MCLGPVVQVDILRYKETSRDCVMMIDLSELSPRALKALTDLAEDSKKNGKTLDTTLCELVNEYLNCSEDNEDTEFLAHCAEELREIEAELGPDALTVENARRILSRVPGSMAEAIIEDRGDR